MRRQITKWGFISGRRPSRKCLAFHLVSILLLLGAQTSAGQDVDSLFQRARAGNKAALHELAKRPSAEVSKLFDELAAIYGNDADFQMEFCTAKASSGDPMCVMRIASQVLWADPAEQVRAAESVPRLEKAMALRILRKLLDEQYTPPPDFDLSFLSPARFSLMTLPSLVANPPAPFRLTAAGKVPSPTAIGATPGDADALYVAEQEGRIWRLEKGQQVVVLDITARVKSGGETGLLGLAFAPTWPQDPRVFVNYTAEEGGLHTVIASFTVDPASHRGDPASEVRILTFDQPHANHNSGPVLFGPDGYLYITTGDGGSGGDPHEIGRAHV